jgi:hypothetical protein
MNKIGGSDMLKLDELAKQMCDLIFFIQGIKELKAGGRT